MEQLQPTGSREGVKDVVSRKVGVMSVVGMFYAMCCAGAFGIEEMIPEVGPGLTIIMLIVLPLVWALPYSYICAELGSARPVEGGNIMWVKEALGEFWFGIMVFVNFIWGLVANTVYVVLAVSYLGKVWPDITSHEMLNQEAYFLKLAMIAIFFIINLLGIKEVSLVSTLLSIAVMAVFMIVAVVGFMNFSQNPMEPMMSAEYDGNVFQTLGAGLAVGMWMYSGFDEISLFAGEVKGAHKIIPKALMIVIPLMILTYILPTVAGLGSIGDWESWTTEPDGIGYHSVLAEYAPAALGVIFVIVAILGQCAIYNMCVAVASRASLVLADENFGPRPLAKLTKKKGMPYVSLIVVVVVTTLLLGTPDNPNDFPFLVLLDVFFSVIVCALTVVSAVILKRQIPPEEIPFKTPGGIAGHNIFVGLCLFFCVALVLVSGTNYFFGGFIVLLLMPIIYAIAKWIWKGASVKEPETYPIDPRTKLGFGDLCRIGGYYFFAGIFGVLARFFLVFYSGDWEPDYLVEEYEEGILADYDGMLNIIIILAGASIVAGAVLWLSGRRLKARDAEYLPKAANQ